MVCMFNMATHVVMYKLNSQYTIEEICADDNRSI